jgi:hypothetical protein
LIIRSSEHDISLDDIALRSHAARGVGRQMSFPRFHWHASPDETRIIAGSRSLARLVAHLRTKWMQYRACFRQLTDRWWKRSIVFT